MQYMNIPDSVLLSMFMSSNDDCHTAHAPSRFFSGTVYSE